MSASNREELNKKYAALVRELAVDRPKYRVMKMELAQENVDEKAASAPVEPENTKPPLMRPLSDANTVPHEIADQRRKSALAQALQKTRLEALDKLITKIDGILDLYALREKVLNNEYKQPHLKDCYEIAKYTVRCKFGVTASGTLNTLKEMYDFAVTPEQKDAAAKKMMETIIMPAMKKAELHAQVIAAIEQDINNEEKAYRDLQPKVAADPRLGAEVAAVKRMSIVTPELEIVRREEHAAIKVHRREIDGSDPVDKLAQAFHAAATTYIHYCEENKNAQPAAREVRTLAAGAKIAAELVGTIRNHFAVQIVPMSEQSEKNKETLEKMLQEVCVANLKAYHPNKATGLLLLMILEDSLKTIYAQMAESSKRFICMTKLDPIFDEAIRSALQQLNAAKNAAAIPVQHKPRASVVVATRKSTIAVAAPAAPVAVVAQQPPAAPVAPAPVAVVAQQQMAPVSIAPVASFKFAQPQPQPQPQAQRKEKNKKPDRETCTIRRTC